MILPKNIEASADIRQLEREMGHIADIRMRLLKQDRTKAAEVLTDAWSKLALAVELIQRNEK